MADKLSRQPQNLPGPVVHGYDLREDMAAAERAMDVCPTLAIGNDG